jgi:hypothetical protein
MVFMQTALGLVWPQIFELMELGILSGYYWSARKIVLLHPSPCFFWPNPGNFRVSAVKGLSCIVLYRFHTYRIMRQLIYQRF